MQSIKMTISDTDYDDETSLSFESRRAESNSILTKFPERVPVLVFRQKRSKVPDLDKHKYLVPSDLTIGQFMFVVRNRLKLREEVALFFNSGTYILSSGELMSVAYHKYKSTDGFLRIRYQGENTFGNV